MAARRRRGSMTFNVLTRSRLGRRRRARGVVRVGGDGRRVRFPAPPLCSERPRRAALRHPSEIIPVARSPRQRASAPPTDAINSNRRPREAVSAAGIGGTSRSRLRALSHSPSSLPSTFLTKPPAVSAAITLHTRSFTSAPHPCRSAAASVARYASQTSAPVIS